MSSLEPCYRIRVCWHTDHVAHTLQRAPPFDAADESIGGMSDPDPDPDPAPIFE